MSCEPRGGAQREWTWGTLRRGEVLGLNRRDIDIAAGSVPVERSLHEFHDGSLELGPTKNGDLRRVYLPSSVMPALRNHLSRFVGPGEDDPVFVGATGERLRPSNFWVIWETARRRAGLTWVRFHDLRPPWRSPGGTPFERKPTGCTGGRHYESDPARDL